MVRNISRFLKDVEKKLKRIYSNPLSLGSWDAIVVMTILVVVQTVLQRAFLDGKTPSPIAVRGWYGRTVVAVMDFYKRGIETYMDF